MAGRDPERSFPSARWEPGNTLLVDTADRLPWIAAWDYGGVGWSILNAMRIAQVAPLVESVPPKLYGGTERVISWLVDELVQLGHEVTLLASGDSATSATLVPVWPRALRLGRPRCDPAAAHTALLERIAQLAPQFDVIHCHTDWTHLPLMTRLGVPFLTTLHNRLDTPGLREVVRQFPDAPFISISNDQRTPLSEVNWLGTIGRGRISSQPRCSNRFAVSRAGGNRGLTCVVGIASFHLAARAWAIDLPCLRTCPIV
jgi:hypothetical protein